MVKEILVDADGLVIDKHEYFSARLARRQNIPLENIMPFFKSEYTLCATGKADLKVEIAQYLPKWNWTDSVDDLLDFWFFGESHVDEQVMAKLTEMRANGIGTYLITDNEAHRAKYIRETMDLGSRFSGHFFSCEIGYTKSQPDFFVEVLKRLNRNPNEVAAWDDDPKNVAIIAGQGIIANVYSNFEQFSQQVDELTQH